MTINSGSQLERESRGGGTDVSAQNFRSLRRIAGLGVLLGTLAIGAGGCGGYSQALQTHNNAAYFKAKLVSNGDWGKLKGKGYLNYYNALAGELNSLKKVNPEKYADYTPERLCDEYRANGIDLFGEGQELLEGLASGRVPKDIDNVWEYREWKRQQATPNNPATVKENKQ